jgi:undecaprenyl-diphosphatase
MGQFDYVIVHFLNSFAHRSWALDTFVSLVEESNLLKGGLGLAFFWWAWFKIDKTRPDRREYLVFAFLASPFAILLGRAIALHIAFRERPFLNPLYHFQVPFTVTGEVHSWNSCPSDHAILFFCLATCLCFISWRVGVLALCHALFVVSLPRIYVGYHYPTDILAGAVIGIAVALLCRYSAFRKWITAPFLRWTEKHPPSFYAFAFLWTFEVSELFITLLNLQGYFRTALRIFPKTHV